MPHRFQFKLSSVDADFIGRLRLERRESLCLVVKEHASHLHELSIAEPMSYFSTTLCRP